MRTIPQAMKTKLQNRFKAISNDSEPTIRVVSTQTSSHMLMTEPIHEDEDPMYGDVALRQMANESKIVQAYAICIDDDTANVYKRTFPATMDYDWELAWEFGEAEDVAMEYDGLWQVSEDYDYYYLQTEEFPYIFTVEDGELYVQKWRDTTTRLLLAEDVSQISACKGFWDTLHQDNDQGLIIGYIRDGAVYYRTLAYSTVSEEKSWESEQEVTELGDNNDTLAVVRLNDFRIGFLTSQNGSIKMAITKRTYPGMSIKPEGVHVATTSASFNFLNARHKYVYNTDRVNLTSSAAFFNLLPNDGDDYKITISSATRKFEGSGTSEICTGAIIYLDTPLVAAPSSTFAARCVCSNTDVDITSVSYDSTDHALICNFTWKSGKTPSRMISQFTITLPNDHVGKYISYDSQLWNLESMTATLEAITDNHYVYSTDSIGMSTSVSAQYLPISNKYEPKANESISLSITSVTFSYVPVGDIPV